MAELTKQYMVYVDKMKVINLELAADYLLMSAVLIEIKSRMLLPKPEEIESEDDPRADLVRRLMEYEAIKLTAQRLGAMPLVGAEIHVVAAYYESISAIKPIDVSLNELVDAFRNVIKRAKLVTHHKVGKQELSVREHMSHILRRLKADGMVAFSRLFYVNTEGIPKLFVFFSYFRISQRRFDPHYTTTSFFADLFAG